MKRKLLLAAASLLAAVSISTISQAQPPPIAKASFKWLSFKGSDGTNYDFPKFGETAEKDANGNPLVALDDAQGELTLEPATWGVEKCSFRVHREIGPGVWSLEPDYAAKAKDLGVANQSVWFLFLTVENKPRYPQGAKLKVEFIVETKNPTTSLAVGTKEVTAVVK